MSAQVKAEAKVECDGVGQRSHQARLVARFDLGVATGWRRVDESDYDQWFIPEDTPFRHGWAANTPGARHKITCTCGQSVELSYDKLIKVLDWARANDKLVSMTLIKRIVASDKISRKP